MESSEQMLYLIKNEFGLHKIGISNNPSRRVREVASASGVNCELVAVWSVKGVDARDCEKYLHNKFSEYRKKGEWFKFRAKNIIKLIESNMPDRCADILNRLNNSAEDLSKIDLETIKRIACGEYVDGFLGWTCMDEARNKIKEMYSIGNRIEMYQLNAVGGVSKFNIGAHAGDWPTNIFPNEEAAIHASIEGYERLISDFENKINKLKEKSNYNPLHKPSSKVDRFTRMHHDSFGCMIYRFDHTGVIRLVKSFLCDKEKTYNTMEEDDYLLVFTDEKGFYIDHMDYTDCRLCTRIHEDYIEFYRFDTEDNARLPVINLTTKNTIGGSKTINDIAENTWIALDRII